MIIGLFGLIGSGKNTVAEYLVTNYGFKQLSWAGSLKDAVSSVFNWDRDGLEGLTEEHRIWREQPDGWWSKKLGRVITPRLMLQEWGTDVCRVNFHKDIWIASLENKIRNESRNIVISDCRFANEQAAIKRLGGINIRVVRDPEPEWVSLVKTNFDLFRVKYPEIHASEYSSIDLKYDHIIHNNGSIDELKNKVKELI